MGSVELRSSIHKIVDTIESEQFLKTVYDFLLQKENHVSGKLWDSLTETQQREVLNAFEESEDENNLIDNEEIVKKLR